MRKKEVSIKQLAKWFFEEDLDNGCLEVSRWKDLTHRDKEEYMKEAKFYFEKEQATWPEGVRERANG